MVAVFGPQSVAEEPFTATGSPVTTTTPPVAAQVGGPSRLAFSVRGVLSLEEGSLLNFVTLNTQPPSPRAERGGNSLSKKMLLVPAARSKKDRKKLKLRAGPQKPKPTETAIEAPFRMVISPALDGAGEQFWRNRTSPLIDAGRTELWHTRLVNLYCLDNLCSGGDSDLNGEAKPESEIRAVWTPGWNVNPEKTKETAPDPFGPSGRPMTLTPKARSEIVSLSSNHKSGNPPTSGRSRLLTLSALGSSHDVRFDFPDLKGDQYGVTHWSNRGTLGRDHYVKVVQSGWLFPFGHEAALIDISERQIDVRSGNAYAVVRKRQYLVVKQKTRNYSSLEFPFTSVTVVDEITPILDEARNTQTPGNTGDGSFWPAVGGRDYLWTLAATDVEGIRVEFQAPMIWVSDATGTGGAGTKRIVNLAGYYAGDARSKRPLGGQSVAYAKPVPGKARQAAFPTDVLELGAVLTGGGTTPRFTPKMRAASIKNPALGGLGGSGAGAQARGALSPEALLRVKPAEVYVKEGFNQAKNAAQTYLTLAEEVALDYTKDAGAAATGALGAPNMELTALSRTLGPLGGTPEDGSLPNLKPADFLKGAKFLGIEFTDVLPASIPLPDSPTRPTTRRPPRRCPGRSRRRSTKAAPVSLRARSHGRSEQSSSGSPS